MADLFGRKRAFLIGIVGFAAASALGGFAVNAGMLLSARALQGVFGALLAPAALSLLTVTFTETRERARAFGIFGAIAGGGGAVGLILGGVLTEYLNWRWSLLINVPIAVIVVFGAIATVREPEGTRNRSRMDIPGVLLVTAGLVSFVYAFTRAESDGWGDAGTIGFFIAAAVLLVAFVIVETRVQAPLLPLRVVTDRNRGGVYLSLGLSVIGMFGVFLFLTYYFQEVKGYSPVASGVAFLPMVGSMLIGSTQIAPRLMTRVPARYLMGPGFLVGAAGMALLAQMKTDSSYPVLIVPALLLLGLGMGTAFMPAMNLATYGVEARDAGVASAMVNTSQQVGGSIGTALLNTVAASATTSWLASHGNNPDLARQAAVHGYAMAAWWGAGLLLVSAAIAFVLINAGRPSDAPGISSAEDDTLVPVIAH